MSNLIENLVDFWNSFPYKQKFLSVCFLLMFILYAMMDTNGIHDFTPLMCLGPICIFAFFTKDLVI